MSANPTIITYKYILALIISVILIAISPFYVLADNYGDYTYSIENKQAIIIRYTGAGENIEIPKKLGGYSVEAIGEMAFSNCKDLKTVVIPSSVHSIGEMAFWGCSGLESVIIPKGVTEIRHRTFYGCTSLKSIIIPESVTSIMSDSFENCPVTIYGAEGAFSQIFARENGINYIETEGKDSTKTVIKVPFIKEYRLIVIDIYFI